MDIIVENAATPAGDPVAVLKLEGELDASSYVELIERARELTQAGASRLLLDLSGLLYMGSAGLFALHSVAMLLRGQAPPDPELGYGALHDAEDLDETISELKLLNPQAQVDRVLERTGMKRFFEVHTDRSTALAAF
ncbi:MAG TPA: STAS domain-containing protein [Candidatus Limnocylindria bacterium]|nr:STAS domain-containing protein [Candidatus Limnocylindria bacterium]